MRTSLTYLAVDNSVKQIRAAGCRKDFAPNKGPFLAPELPIPLDGP